MFLNGLNDKEKVAFLELAYHIARSDGHFSEEEEATIETYCIEMDIDNVTCEESVFNLENTLSKFDSKESQRIALLEIMALIYSDGIEDEEQKIIDTMINMFEMTEELSKTYAKWTQDILKISAQGQELIYL